MVGAGDVQSGKQPASILLTVSEIRGEEKHFIYFYEMGIHFISERLEISSRELEIPREHSMQRWAQ